MVPLVVWGNHHSSGAEFQSVFTQLVREQKRFNDPIFVDNSPNSLIGESAGRKISTHLSKVKDGPSAWVVIFGDQEIHYDHSLSFTFGKFESLFHTLKFYPKASVVICGVIPNQTYEKKKIETYRQVDSWIRSQIKFRPNINFARVAKRLNPFCYDRVNHLNEKGQRVVAQSLAKALYCIPRKAFRYQPQTVTK